MQTGGRTLGIPAGVDVHPILPKYAKTDFKHDFTGAQITTNVLNDIETVGSRAEFFAKIQPFVGKDVYGAFQQYFSATLPRLPGRGDETPVEDMPEERLLDSILMPSYAEIAGGVGQSVYDSTRVTVNEGGMTRNYGVIRVAEKLKAGAGAAYASQLADQIPVPGQYVNLVSCLWAASSIRAGQRVKTFVIMYDAAVVAASEIGDMTKPSITEILVPDAQGRLFGEQFDKTAIYEVYFVNSTENVRDPAPKLTEKSFRPDKVAPNIHLYFLTDPDHQVQYEMHARAPATQASNLYSRYTLRMTRIGSSDRVRAVIEFEDGTTVQLDDLKRESEIDASVVNAISILLRKGFSTAMISEVMSCFFLKRSGDWCQALCLLDKERVYQISGTGPKAGGTTTLAALEAEGAEIMLMTHDRVLLAYALLLGLNVCFTNNRSSGHWIIYFKNLDVFRVDDYEAVRTSASALLSELTAARAAANRLRTELTDQVGKIRWLPFANLIQIRRRLNVLANLPSNEELGAVITSLQTLETDLTSAKYEPIRAAVLQANSLAGLPDDASKALGQAFSDALGRLRTALPNIRSMLDGVMKYTNPAFQYPQQVDEIETVGSHLLFVLNGQRSMKESHKDPSGKTFNLEASLSVLASRLMDDFAQASVRVNDLTLEDYPAEATLSTTLAAAYGLARVTRTHLSIARGIFDLVKKAQAKQGRGQRGGMKGGGGIEDLYYFPNTIYLLTEISVRSMPPGTPDTGDSYYFVQGTRMIHYDRWQYTVVDDYIVTKELEPALVGALATFLKGRYASLTSTESPVILHYLHVFFLRLLILWADILYNESLVLFDEPLHIDDTGEEDDLFTEVTRPDEVLLFRLSRRLAFLQQILAPTVLSAIQTSDPAQYARSIELTLDYSNGSFQLPREMRLPTSDEFQTQVGNLVGGLLQLYTASPASKFLATIRQAELRTAVVPEDGDPFIAFFDPLNGTVIPAPLPPTAILVGPQLTIPEGFGGFRFFQNIATNVYVPLVPQPTPEETAEAIAALRGGSRLHPRRALYRNARTRTSSSARRGLYAGLRERTWPRTTSRVRQRSGRAKTGRQRKHLDRL